MDREIESRMHKLLNQNQEKENNSELLNNNLRFNYSSQPALSSSLNFQSRANIIRLKELPSVINLEKKKNSQLTQAEPIRGKGSLDAVQKYRGVPPSEATSRTESDNYT